jgi:hypothetical protein
VPTSFRREGWESRAIHSAECYPAQPLLPNLPTASTFLRTVALLSASDGPSRSETMNRE